MEDMAGYYDDGDAAERGEQAAEEMWSRKPGEPYGMYQSRIARMQAGRANAALSASPIACAVADAWAHAAQKRMSDYADLHTYAPGLPAALDALEAATRESPLRKVRP